MNTLAAFWPQGLLTLALIFICGLLMLVILIQKGRGGGLSGAFGGGGGGSTAFGTKTGDVFTWITIALASLFLLTTIVANFAFDQSGTPAVITAPAVPVAVPTGIQGTTGSGENIDIGGFPDVGIESGGIDEDLTNSDETPADGGAGDDTPPAEDPPATQPTGTESPADPDGGGTPAP